MGTVRDDGYDRTAALRALASMLDVARTGARDLEADALAEAIENARAIALQCIRASEH